MGMKRQSTWERKILRRMCGPVVEQGICRIRADEELRVLYKVLDIVADIKKKILEWTGRVVRMDQGRTVKKVFGSELEGSGRRGRSRLRCWKMWRRILVRSEGSGQGRMGVCNY
jgi:hypothetical protein